MSNRASDSVVSKSSAGREVNGRDHRETHGSTPRVVVTTRSIPRARFGSTARELFRDPWTPTYTPLLRLILLDLKSWKIWRAAVLEGIFTGMWIEGSIMIITASANWGSLLGRTLLVAGFLHTVMFTVYLQAGSFVSTGDGQTMIPCLNPAITLLKMLLGGESLTSGLLVMIMQCVGAILANLCAKDVLPQDRIDFFMMTGCFGRRTILGPTGTPIVIGLSDHKYFLSEFVFAFTFLYITALVTHPKQLRVLGVKGAVLLISVNIGFITYISTSLRPGYGGSTFNPARCLGAAVAYGQPLWDRLWPPFFAPYVAAFAVAFLLATVPPDHNEVYETKKDVISGIRRWSKSTRRSPSSQLDDPELENNTVYEVPSAGRLFSATPETPADFGPPPEQSEAV